LTEYLLDEVLLEQLLIHPGIGRFVFLPGGRPITNSTEALASPKMASLVEELKHRYPARLIVFDLPPLLTRADVLGFATHLDAVLLVAEEGKTASTDIQRSISLLKGTVPLLGAVLNKAGRSGLSRRRAMEMLAS
jgi:Mrp family chromosome partitioning ATPase